MNNSGTYNFKRLSDYPKEDLEWLEWCVKTSPDFYKKDLVMRDMWVNRINEAIKEKKS